MCDDVTHECCFAVESLRPGLSSSAAAALEVLPETYAGLQTLEIRLESFSLAWQAGLRGWRLESGVNASGLRRMFSAVLFRPGQE